MLVPTWIAELIPDCDPATNGACDAAAAGMGGVHFVPTNTSKIPILWRQQFPEWIRQHLSLYADTKGWVTNSDLELAESIAHNDILSQAADVRKKTTHNLYDIIAAVFWQ